MGIVPGTVKLCAGRACKTIRLNLYFLFSEPRAVRAPNGHGRAPGEETSMPGDDPGLLRGLVPERVHRHFRESLYRCKVL